MLQCKVLKSGIAQGASLNFRKPLAFDQAQQASARTG